MAMKPAIFHPAARLAIRGFPSQVRRTLGQAIWDLQRGLRVGMPLSKPMPSVAPGVAELRVKDATGAYRAFYITSSGAAVIVFHAFTKKTQKTPLNEIRTGRKRLKEML